MSSRLFLFALASSLALAGCGEAPQQQMPPPSVGVITIKETPVALTTELPGRTSPYAVSEIRPQITGIVKARLFVEGSAVKAGQALYQIDPAPYEAAYAAAAATLAAAKTRADRFAILLKENAVAPQANDDARATYLQAKAQADAARINLNYTRITSPISGRIGASSVTVGALVTAQQPIYVDVDQSSSELVALRRAAQAGTLSEGGTAVVKLKLEDGSDYAHEGKLQFTDVTVDPSTGAVRLRAIFPNPEGLLLPGLYVRATVTQGTDPHGILAPQQGVGRNAKGEPTALVVDAKNFARLRVLKTGRSIGGDWQVLEGLKVGDRVIVEGLQRVQPDMPVSPRPMGAAPATPAGAPSGASGAQPKPAAH
jgi:membrane fusion protein (multidrug efflux system)